MIDILAAHPEVWSKMALFITYDEDGGFFDHVVPPPPEPGRSTVPITNEIFPGDPTHLAGPYGLGRPVPMIVVSPWTRGGSVNSQLFDHTSIIRFLEARFAGGRPDLIESTITPWRRTVVGDLTTAFNFATPNRTRPAGLPGTDDFGPGLRRPAVPVGDRDQLLGPVGTHPDHHQGAQPRLVQPHRELHPLTIICDGSLIVTTCGSVVTLGLVKAVRSSSLIQRLQGGQDRRG